MNHYFKNAKDAVMFIFTNLTMSILLILFSVRAVFNFWIPLILLNNGIIGILKLLTEKWLQLCPGQKSIFRDLILFEALDAEQYPAMLNNILSVILSDDDVHDTLLTDGMEDPD